MVFFGVFLCISFVNQCMDKYAMLIIIQTNKYDSQY